METVKDNNSVRAVPSPLGESICSPTEIYKVFPNSKDVAFPAFKGTVRVTGSYSQKFAQSVKVGERFIFVRSFKDGTYDDMNSIVLPAVKSVGTLCEVVSLNLGDFASTIEYNGLEIVNLSDFDYDTNFELVVCHAIAKRDISVDSVDLNAYLSRFQVMYAKLRQKYATLHELADLSSISAEKVPFLLANFIDSDVNIKQSLLECMSSVDRMKFLINDLERFNQDAKIDYELDRAVNKALDRNQREFILREKMKALKEALKEFDGDDSDAKYTKAITEHGDM